MYVRCKLKCCMNILLMFACELGYGGLVINIAAVYVKSALIQKSTSLPPSLKFCISLSLILLEV